LLFETKSEIGLTKPAGRFTKCDQQQVGTIVDNKKILLMNRLTFKTLCITVLLLMTAIKLQAQMTEAYELANEMVREKLNKEDKANIRILDDLTKNDIVVVNGTYDHISQVLTSLKIPFAQIDQYQLIQADLKPHQTVFVNCASDFPVDAARKLATFVEAGGQLITTDWALKNAIEVAFPNTIAFNNTTTADEVVRIEVVDKQDSVVLGFLDEKAAPVWWLEGSSYPIKILNKERVKVLIRSNELKEKYGDESVVVRFEHGRGTVYHMLSHLYLQRTETRDKRQEATASDYFADKGASEKTKQKAAGSNVTYGQVQSANTTSDFVSRTIIKQKKKVATIKK
jgi:hypothetical protein